MLIRL